MTTLTLHLKALADAVYTNRRYQYWMLQFIGWGGLCVVTFFSLTLWYSTAQWSYIAHTLLQSALGVLLTVPLHRVYRTTWARSILQRAAISLVSVTMISMVWTVLRILAFEWLTGETGIFDEFGGWYFSSFLVYLCWTALYYGNKYYHQAEEEHRLAMDASAAIRSEQIRRLKAESDARNAQLAMLRYQLNPHFLFNTLNAISALVKFEENDKAHKMITRLGYFLRYSLDNNPALVISLQQEIDALMLYLAIEKTRFEDKLSIVFDVEDKARQALVPSLLLQPLYENSIKYAIAMNEEGGTIRLTASVEDNTLKIEVTDTGPGQSTSGKSPKTGRRVGLHNTLQRLKTLYEDAYVFDISLRESSGLRVTIHIPYRLNHDPA